MKIFILFLFLMIVISLFTALHGLMKDQGQGTRTVKALTFRIGFSFVLIIVLFLSYKMGWIKPSQYTADTFQGYVDKNKKKQEK